MIAFQEDWTRGGHETARLKLVPGNAALVLADPTLMGFNLPPRTNIAMRRAEHRQTTWAPAVAGGTDWTNLTCWNAQPASI